MSSRWILALVIALLWLPLPAGADIQGPCDGSVTIDGVAYGPQNDTPANPIVVPNTEGLVAAWEGSTGPVITDHTGHLDLVIGPGSVRLADWAGENADREVSASGTYSVDEAFALLPIDVVGLYELTGSHAGNGGSCTGSVMVLIEGNPLGTPIGLVALIGLLLALVGIGLARRLGSGAGRMVLGAIAGLLAGVFAAVLLQQYGIRPLDNLSVLGIPLVMLVLGIILAQLGATSASVAD